MTGRLTAADVGAWLLKSARPPDVVSPGWVPDTEVDLVRCVRPSYRLDLVAPGQPCVLWVSGRDDPGVHAVGVVTGPVSPGPELPVRWRRLVAPVPREALLADPVARTAEVLRMPAGSNPSWLSPDQWRAVQDLAWAAAPT